MNEGANEATKLYAGREQTLVKHFILDKYLERFAHIVGMFWDTITYVDCFSGPWNVQSDKLEDSSFFIALKQLRKAKADLADHGRSLSIRCFFLEEDETAYARLNKFAVETKDAEVKALNASLEQSVQDIHRFVTSGGDSSFSFIFVDPTGWTGFGMDVIKPLLRLKSGEVLVNFMTKDIVRFAELPDPATQKTFDRLFGAINYRGRIESLTGRDREEELVCCYMDAIRETGGFKYVCAAIVLRPERDRTHFHLIYATRHLKGVEAFKKVEEKAMDVMERARADAQKRCRETKTGQTEFAFEGLMSHSCNYYDQLRDRYLKAAKGHVWALLTKRKRLLFEDAWVGALQFPLVWDSDVKAWIKAWKAEGSIRLEGLGPGEHAPKREMGHRIVLEDSS